MLTDGHSLRRPLFRGVRGALPRSFWLPDEQGMVCAVDMGFMSTSRDRATPIRYMGEGKDNVLWHLRPQPATPLEPATRPRSALPHASSLARRPQSDVAFHHGADIKLLSQFAAENEVLFPPCAMLRCLERETLLPGRSCSPPSSPWSGLLKQVVTKVRAFGGRGDESAESMLQVTELTEQGKGFKSVSVLPYFL